jgi:hypothetical protein
MIELLFARDEVLKSKSAKSRCLVSYKKKGRPLLAALVNQNQSASRMI